MDKDYRKTLFYDLLVCGLAVTICIIFLIYILQLWNIDINVPFVYGGDTNFHLTMIKGMIDNGWYLHNDFLGAPFEMDISDFPVTNNIDMIIIKIISLFLINAAATMNFFYLLTFPLTTIITYFVFRKLNISYAPALIGSILFTFIPYHFRNEGYLPGIGYYSIPLLILIIFWIFDGTLDLSWASVKKMDKKIIFVFISSLLIGLNFIYFTFWSLGLLLITGISASFDKKDLKPLKNGIICIILISFFMLVNISPYLINQIEEGKNYSTGVRNVAESELYGLKIVQLILPIYHNTFPDLAYITWKYESAAPLISENRYAALGIIGSIGFLILIIWLIFYRSNPLLPDFLPVHERLGQLSLLNIFAVLIGTVGGFGTIFSFFITPTFRCGNRISVFIALFSIMAICLFMDYILKKTERIKILYFVFLGLLGLTLIFGLIDQSGYPVMPYHTTKVQYENDYNYISLIEDRLPQDSMIFQLPYYQFPEGWPPGRMLGFDPLTGYLHSHNLKWSFGTMMGRPEDSWQQNISNKSTGAMVNDLIGADFAGILVDTSGYNDNGQNIMSELKSILQTDPIIDNSQRYYFFPFSNFKRSQNLSNLNPDDFLETFIYPLNIEWQESFYISSNNEIACANNGKLIIHNNNKKNITMHIEMDLLSYYPEYCNIAIKQNNIQESFRINNQGHFYQNDWIIPNGDTIVMFSCDEERIIRDPRNLVFRIDNLSIKQI